MASNHTTNTLERIGDQVITLDMDGTLEDPWACCGKRDRMGGSETCRHVRQDILTQVANVRAVYPDAKPVILSWRGGCEGVTRQWLETVGIEFHAVFVPGSADARAIQARGEGQIGFKVGIIRALRAQGVEVITGWDDNVNVVEALRAEGVPALQAKHLVDVKPHEYRAGYLGAPERGTGRGFDFPTTPGDLYNQPETVGR